MLHAPEVQVDVTKSRNHLLKSSRIHRIELLYVHNRLRDIETDSSWAAVKNEM